MPTLKEITFTHMSNFKITGMTLPVKNSSCLSLEIFGVLQCILIGIIHPQMTTEQSMERNGINLTIFPTSELVY